jgi:dienelactone hydrolase
MDRREMLRLSAALAATGGLHPRLAAIDDKLTPDEMIHNYLKAEVERISKNFLDGATTKAEWEQKRPELKRQFLSMAGLDPLPERTPLKATVTGTLDRDGVAIEKLHFQSRPGLYVTANLYRPKPGGAKLPGILYVCGHSGRGRDGNKTAFQDHGTWFASNGYVCLIVDTLQLGEVAGIHHGTYREGRWWWHSRGYTPAGVECWNGIRGIDYLCSRPEVDPNRIGVTGISGGGATTVWVAAADERVKVAVPVSGMSDLESYVSNKVINGHCDCMFVHNAYRWEWTTILALFAPKPLLFANSDNDPIFPMDGNRRIIARLRQCYGLLGAKDLVDEYVSKGGHDYRPDLRTAIFQFFERHLKGTNKQVADETFDVIPGKQLRVFPEDADLPKDAINSRVDEVFVDQAEVKLPAEAKDFPAWKAGLVKQLRAKCFRALPEKVPGPKPVRPFEAEWEYYAAEEGAVSEIRTFPKSGDNSIPVLIVVLNPAEDAEEAVRSWRKQLSYTGRAVACHPRGGGKYRWTTKNPPNTVERSLALLGQTVDTGRVRDLISLFGKLADSDFEVRLVGRGAAGVIAAYAAPYFASPPNPEVVILDPPTSHRDGPHFLNVLRVLDIPEALGLLAPDVKLTLVGEKAKDKAFDKTAAIYRLAGAEDKFKRA